MQNLNFYSASVVYIQNDEYWWFTFSLRNAEILGAKFCARWEHTEMNTYTVVSIDLEEPEVCETHISNLKCTRRMPKKMSNSTNQTINH